VAKSRSADLQQEWRARAPHRLCCERRHLQNRQVLQLERLPLLILVWVDSKSWVRISQAQCPATFWFDIYNRRVKMNAAMIQRERRDEFQSLWHLLVASTNIGFR
jgi:hypothetical protein